MLDFNRLKFRQLNQCHWLSCERGSCLVAPLTRRVFSAPPYENSRSFLMKLKDLKFIDNKPKIEPERTQLRMFCRLFYLPLVLDRVRSFLQAAEQTAAPTEFESPPENSRHIELDIYVPTDGPESSVMLTAAEQSDSLSPSSSSSSSESDADGDDLVGLEKLRVPCSSKRPKIEEVKGETEKPLP
ncbi:hypothetical protein SprV_0401600800 [Sparganum proliferum]